MISGCSPPRRVPDSAGVRGPRILRGAGAAARARQDDGGRPPPQVRRADGLGVRQAREEHEEHLLQTLDELNGFGVQFLSQREAIDTEGPLGRAIIVIVSAMAELERFASSSSAYVRACAGRSWKEGRSGGRGWTLNREQVIRDRRSGMSLTQVAKKHCISGERVPPYEGQREFPSRAPGFRCRP